MRTLLALSIALAAIWGTDASASPPLTTYTYLGWQIVDYPADAAGYRVITDTLGGQGGHVAPPPRGYTFTTDTLAGDGHPGLAGTPRQTFISDTLAPGGTRPGTLPAAEDAFSWSDAGVGAGTGIAVILLVTGTTLLLLRRNGRLVLR